MRPIYNPIHTASKPKAETQSNKQTPAAPNTPAKNPRVVQKHSDAPQASLAAAPVLAQNNPPKASPKPLVFRDVGNQDLANLIKDESAFNAALQDGSIFEMRSPNANALVAACHFKKFDWATKLLEHPLAEEAFLKDSNTIASTLNKLFDYDYYSENTLYSLLKTFMQRINVKALEEGFPATQKPNLASEIFKHFSKIFTYYKDSENLKKLLSGLNDFHRSQCCEASLGLFKGKINPSKIPDCFRNILEVGIRPDKTWINSFLSDQIKYSKSTSRFVFEMLTLLKDKNIISEKDGIERDYLLEIYPKVQKSYHTEPKINFLSHIKTRNIQILSPEQEQGMIQSMILDSLFIYKKEEASERKPIIEAIFSYIKESEAKDMFDAKFIHNFFFKEEYLNKDWNPLTADYANWLLDKITNILGKEHFTQCIENPSILSEFLLKNQYLSSCFKIDSLIRRGANPMAKIDPESPDTVLNLALSLDIHRSLAQSQDPEYKQFVLETMFGLKSAKLTGGYEGSSIPIIEQAFEAFLKTFPTRLDPAILERIQQTSAQSKSFFNRKDLLEHFVKNPDDSEAIQVAYLGADKHAYAYLIYKDILIETQRAEETTLLEGSDNALFYFTNANSFDTQKVRAIQVLPLDKEEAKAILKAENPKKPIDKSVLRLGKNSIAFCKANAHPIKDVGPLLNNLGLETSWSIIKDPKQQKKVALAEILTTLGYLENDGSGATVEAFKDKESSQIAQDLARDTAINPKDLINWLEDSSISKIDCLKNVLDALGITKKSLYYISDTDRKDPLAKIAFEKTPQKTGNCYFTTPLLNVGGLMWWATVLEKAKQQGITVDREHMAQNPEFYKAIYTEVEPTYKEFVKFMKLNAWEDYKNRFGTLPTPAMQAELDEKLAKLQNSNTLGDSDEDL